MNRQQGYRRVLKSAQSAAWKSRRSQKQLHRLLRNEFQVAGAFGGSEELTTRVKATEHFHREATNTGTTAHKVIKNITDIYHSHTSPKNTRNRRKTVAAGRWNALDPPQPTATTKAAQKMHLKHAEAVDRMRYINRAPLWLGEVVAQAEQTSGVILGRLRGGEGGEGKGDER
ncbi:hypothetical protein E3P92_00888 [Wallemia ichthyophaga]|nr:hypothetical protein E3P92_00888 [Wallemia ichthyophaga]